MKKRLPGGPKAFDKIPFKDCLREKLDPSLSGLEGMLSPNEWRFLRWYARKVFRGGGAIVDLGSWLGASTASLAAGLTARPKTLPPSPRIHAYDSFLWRNWMNKSARSPKPYKDGDSFLEEFRQNIAPWSRFIEVHPETFAKPVWKGGPIEMIFVDAMKSWDTARAIVVGFFPALIPGKSLIVHQDFKHYYHPWIHLLMYRLREHCRPIYDLPETASMVFGVVHPLDHKLCEKACDFSSFSAAEVAKAFQYAKGFCPNAQVELAAAQVMSFIHLAREAFQKNSLSKQTGHKSVQALMGNMKF